MHTSSSLCQSFRPLIRFSLKLLLKICHTICLTYFTLLIQLRLYMYLDQTKLLFIQPPRHEFGNSVYCNTTHFSDINDDHTQRNIKLLASVLNMNYKITQWIHSANNERICYNYVKITKHVNICKIFPDIIIFFNTLLILFLSKFLAFSCLLICVMFIVLRHLLLYVVLFLLLVTWLLNQHVKRQEFNSTELNQWTRSVLLSKVTDCRLDSRRSGVRFLAEAAFIPCAASLEFSDQLYVQTPPIQTRMTFITQ